jgi:hypothetical protein
MSYEKFLNSTPRQITDLSKLNAKYEENLLLNSQVKFENMKAKALNEKDKVEKVKVNSLLDL